MSLSCSSHFTKLKLLETFHFCMQPTRLSRDDSNLENKRPNEIGVIFPSVGKVGIKKSNLILQYIFCKRSVVWIRAHSHTVQDSAEVPEKKLSSTRDRIAVPGWHSDKVNCCESPGASGVLQGSWWICLPSALLRKLLPLEVAWISVETCEVTFQ